MIQWVRAIDSETRQALQKAARRRKAEHAAVTKMALHLIWEHRQRQNPEATTTQAVFFA